MDSPRRTSARKSTAIAASPLNGSVAVPAPTSSKGKGKASSRDSGAVLLSPIKPEEVAEDRSSDVEVVVSKTQIASSSLSTKKTMQANGTATFKEVKAAVMAVAPRFSSEELTDLEELDKALQPTAKKAAPLKRKPIPKDTEKKESNGVSGLSDADEAQPKRKAPAKKARTKKIQGPYLPVVEYPERDLTGKKYIGAHVSIAEAAHYAPHRALRLGARAFALFVKSQRQWTGKPFSEESIKLFPLRCKGKTELEPDETGKVNTAPLGDGLGFDPLRHIVPHGSYLTNLCHNGEEQRKKSYDNFLTELKMAEELGIGLFNFHPGSTLGAPRDEAYARLADCINEAHKETKFIVILLENMASTKNIVGGSFQDLAAVIALVKDKSRIGVCFDTCHGFAAGYDLRTEDAYNETWRKFDEIVGLKYLKAFHVNDSMKELGSGRDLHQNIGAGELGLSSFHLLMRDPRFDGLPFILETPMLSGSLNVDAKPGQASGSSTPAGQASTSKVKIEVKMEENGLNGHDHSHGDDADVEDNDSGQPGLTVGASTWKREIELLQELQRVPFGQSNAKIDQLSGEINEIVAEYRAKQEAQEKAAKELKDAAKAAKKAAELAEKGAKPPAEKKPRAPRPKKEKAVKVEVKEREPSEEMEIDSSEIDQLASDYEESPVKVYKSAQSELE